MTTLGEASLVEDLRVIGDHQLLGRTGSTRSAFTYDGDEALFDLRGSEARARIVKTTHHERALTSDTAYLSRFHDPSAHAGPPTFEALDLTTLAPPAPFAVVPAIDGGRNAVVGPPGDGLRRALVSAPTRLHHVVAAPPGPRHEEPLVDARHRRRRHPRPGLRAERRRRASRLRERRREAPRLLLRRSDAVPRPPRRRRRRALAVADDGVTWVVSSGPERRAIHTLRKR